MWNSTTIFLENIKMEIRLAVVTRLRSLELIMYLWHVKCLWHSFTMFENISREITEMKRFVLLVHIFRVRDLEAD